MGASSKERDNVKARGCQVESGSVTLAMTMTLPALTATAGMSPETLNRWNTFINKLNTRSLCF